jgi:hypothetical protein
VLQSLLRHPDPGIRASVCGCARRRPELISVMIDLLEDLNQGVARSAAYALGQIGRIEARPMLAKLLREDPSEELIDAVSSIADEECLVQLGRIARTEPALSDAALNALEGIDQPSQRTAAMCQIGRDWMNSGHVADIVDAPQMTPKRHSAKHRVASARATTSSLLGPHGLSITSIGTHQHGRRRDVDA